MTKIRQKRFSNGKIQNQHKSLNLKEFKALSLADAYAIVSGYKQIPAKSSELRILVYKRALEMVQQHDAQFAKKAKSKPNPEIKKSLELNDAYNIVGGYLPADEKTFKQAIKTLKNDKTDPEFAALVIKFAESHMPFSAADDEILAKVNEEGLSFFDNVDINKVVENVSKDKEIQKAQERTPVAFNTDTPEAEKEANEIAQKGTIYSAATKAMEMPQSGNDENAFEEDVKKQTAAQIISLRLEEVNKDYDESVIEAIKSNSEKPLSTFRKKMKNAWDFTKKISISPESVKNVCEKAKTRLNKVAKRISISAKTKIASAEFTLHQMKPRGKAAVLAGLMMVTTFIGCTSNNKGKSLSEDDIAAIQKASIDLANDNSIAFAEAQKQAEIEKAKKEAAAKKARRDAIMNMTVPHEWNDSMGISKWDLDNNLSFFGEELHDKMYRNLELAKGSLAEITQSDASTITIEKAIKRFRQQVQFKYGVKLDAQGNPEMDENGKPKMEVRQAYIVAQNVIQILNRPCDGVEFNPTDLNKSDLQLLFDTLIPVGNRKVKNSRWIDNGCGEDGKIQASICQSETQEVVDTADVAPAASQIELGAESSLTVKEKQETVVVQQGITFNKFKASTASDGTITASDFEGEASTEEVSSAGKNAAKNDDKVFVNNDIETVIAASATVGEQAAGTASTTTASATEITLSASSTVKENVTNEETDDGITFIRHNVSTDKNGGITADTNIGETTADVVIEAGEGASQNSSSVYTNQASDKTVSHVGSTATQETTITLGASSEIKTVDDETSNASGAEVVAADEAGNASAAETVVADAAGNASGTEVVADGASTVQTDDSKSTGDADNTLFTFTSNATEYDILRPDSNSIIPDGTPSAWGEISGRKGLNFTSVSEKSTKDDRTYFGPKDYEKGIERFSQHPELFVFGGPLSGSTPQQSMHGLKTVMQWLVTKDGNLISPTFSDKEKEQAIKNYRTAALALMDFIKGDDCLETFTTEQSVAIQYLFEHLYENGTIDHIVGEKNIQNTSYTFTKGCGEKGSAAFSSTSDSGPTYPGGERLERVYAKPRPTLPILGASAEIVQNTIVETEIVQPGIDLYKFKTSTKSNNEIAASTPKGKASAAQVRKAGNKAKQNTSNVFVNQDVRGS